MLLLIAGVTGNIGRELHLSALRRGHQVRGLGRSPQKLDPSCAVESFVVIADHLDVEAYEQACQGVDAVICAWTQDPRLVLDAQLLLFRAAEKANVKRFHGVSWGWDWTKFQLGQLSPYDPYISFDRQVQNTSVLRPCFTFSGGYAKPLFGQAGTGVMTEDKSMWVSRGDAHNNKRIFKVFGSERWQMNWTPEPIVADFTVALITSHRAEKGGYFRISSDTFGPIQVRDAFQRARGPEAEVEFTLLMSIDAIKAGIAHLNGVLLSTPPKEYLSKKAELALLEYAYHIAAETGRFEPVDNDLFPEIQKMSLEDYIRQNEWV
jgi:hypothetical protein